MLIVQGLNMEATARLLNIEFNRAVELHTLCQKIIDICAAKGANCAETIQEINKHADRLTCIELIYVTFKIGRIFQYDQTTQ